MTQVEAIIPYYQSEAGHLLRAVRSVLDQEDVAATALVVDDGSPRPAREDLDALEPAERARVRLIEQPNAGASGARNTGLDAVAPDTRFVAFLDSDDVWQPQHLARACKALSRPGARLFQDGVEADEAFAEGYAPPSDLIDPRRAHRPGDAPHLLQVDHPIRLLCGPWFRHMHLSVTVLTTELARRVRFDPAFSYADDFDFFHKCARQGGTWFIDDRPGARRGTGDNLWHGVGPADMRYSMEKLFSARILARLERDPDLDPGSRSELQARRMLYRSQFYWAQRDRMRAGAGPDLALWRRFLASDPRLASFALARLLRRPLPDLSAASDGIPPRGGDARP